MSNPDSIKNTPANELMKDAGLNSAHEECSDAGLPTEREGARPAEIRRLAFPLFLFLICINVPSMGALRIPLAGFAVMLLVIGLRSLPSLVLLMAALVPIQSSLLGFGSVFGFELTFNRVAVCILAACYFLRGTKYVERGRGREPLLYWLLGILALSTLSDMFGDGTFLAGAQQTVSEGVEVVLFAYICYRLFPRAELARVVSAFAVGGILQCISIVIERVTGTNFLFRFPTSESFYAELQAASTGLERGDVLRVRGPFQNPVYLSGFLPLLLFAAVYLVVVHRRRLLGGGLLILVLLTACLSISRTAMYALVLFGLPVLYITQIRRGIGHVVKLAVLAAVLAGALYAAFPADIKRAFTLTVNPYEESLGGADTADRLNLIASGVPFVLGLNPFGAGVEEGHLISALLGADIANFFIGYAIQRGVIWVAAFCFLLVYMAWRLIRAGDTVAWMLFWLTASITATYLSYAEYWISFPMLLVFVLIHIGGRSHEAQESAEKAVCVAIA